MLLSDELDADEPTTGSLSRRRASSPTRELHCSRDDIVLVDTGALKMWMARLYPTYEPNTCLISNGLVHDGLDTARGVAAKFARPERKVSSPPATADS